MRRNHPASAASALCGFPIEAGLLLTVLLFFLPLFSTVAETDAPWFFLPTFKHQITGLQQITAKDITAGATPFVISAFVARTPELTEEGKKLLVWRAATFPHQDFVKLMPKNNVFGWYAHVFDQPPELLGFDLLLDLGVIDDSDETFLNGTLIGKTGSVPGGSAWNTDRLYRIPAELITEKGNVLASHVWSQWGLGGIVGPPVLKAALVPPDAQWELAFIKDEKAPTAGLNRVKSADDALALCFGETAPAWQKAAMPWAGWMYWPDDAHFAVFRTTLNLPKKSDQTAHFHSPVVLDIGPVFDVAAVFLNGRRIGLTGRFPEDREPAFTEAARRGQYLIASQDWNVHGDNRLTVVIYRERGIGGLPGVPGILLENPINPLRRNLSVAECFTSFDILHQSQKHDEAEHSLDEARPDNDLDQVWLLSHRAHLAWLRWLDGERDEAALDGVLKPIHEILTKYPVESPKQSAMQAFCRVLRIAEKDQALLARVRHYFPDFSKDCKYLEPDRLTKGDWQMHYGTRFYVLAAMGQICDWSGGLVKCSYRLHTPGQKDVPRYWLPKSQRNLISPAAMIMPMELVEATESLTQLINSNISPSLFPKQKIRRASWWDDHGEMHPFDDAGPDMFLQVMLLANESRFSIYLLDYDWRSTLHPRQQSLILFDDSASMVNAVWSGKSDSGVYERFLLLDKSTLKARFNKHRGACVAVSGFFVDQTPVLPQLSGTLHGTVDPKLIAFYEQLRQRRGSTKLDIATQLLQSAPDLLSETACSLGLFLYTVAAECSFSTYSLSHPVIQRLNAFNDASEVLEWLTAMHEVEHSQLLWYYLGAASIFEKVKNMPAAKVNDTIFKLAIMCGNHNLYPIQRICFNFLNNSKQDKAIEMAEHLKSNAPIYFKINSP